MPARDRRISSSSAPDWRGSRLPASWSARASRSSCWRRATGSADALLNHSLGGGAITEVGGEYIGPTQDRIAALAKAVGVDTFKTYNDGSNLLQLDGKISRYPAAGLPTDPAVASDIIRLIGIIDGLAKTLPIDVSLDGAAGRRVRRSDARDVPVARRFAIAAPGC